MKVIIVSLIVLLGLYLYEKNYQIPAIDLTKSTNKYNDLAKSRLIDNCAMLNGNINFDDNNRIATCNYRDSATNQLKSQIKQLSLKFTN